MITAFYSLDRVVGAEIMLIGFGSCTLLYYVLCLIAKDNRSCRSILFVTLGWLIAEALCDGAWFAYYFPYGYYVNHGIGGIYAVLLWPVLLVLAGLTVTTLNAKEKRSDK